MCTETVRTVCPSSLKKNNEQAFGIAIKENTTWDAHILWQTAYLQVPTPIPILFPANAYPRSQHMMAQLLGALLPMWTTR